MKKPLKSMRISISPLGILTVLALTTGSINSYASCSVSVGATINSGRYNISTACLTDYGWNSPIPETSSGFITTSTAYDFQSAVYSLNNGVSWTHGGVDYVGSTNNPYTTQTPVYAIGNGTVRYVSRSTVGTANTSRVHIEHIAANGTRFLAIYGHVYSNLNIGDTTQKGDKIGTLRVYGSPTHLHFELNTILTTTSFGSVKNGTVDPMQFLIQNPNESTKSRFDGVGSLVDPIASTGCRDGCKQDTIKLHSHADSNQKSTGMFQVYNIPGVCSSIELTGLQNADVEVRPWNSYGANSTYYYAKTMPAIIPLSDNAWSLISVTTTAPIESGGSRYLVAKCLSSAPNPYDANIEKKSSGSPLEFDNNYFWGGNGSLISHSTNQQQPVYGRTKDVAKLLRDNKTISAFQIQKSNCPSVVINAKNLPFEASWKQWDAKDWVDGSMPYTNLNLTLGDGSWWLIKIKTEKTNTNNSEVSVTCTQ